MDLLIAEQTLRWRWFQWAKATARREVAEGFPFLHACQNERTIKCFLAWMQEFNQSEQLALCDSLVNRSYDQFMSGKSGQCSPEDHLAFEAKLASYYKYHEILPPTPDCDKSATGFVRADAGRFVNTIMGLLEPICGRSRKAHRTKLHFSQSIGDWELTTHVQVHLRNESVDCHHFFNRIDRPRPAHEAWHKRIDPLILLGVYGCNFPFLSKNHEKLCAESICACTQVIVSAAPKILAGLGEQD